MFGWLGALFGFIGRFGWIVLLCAILFLIGILLTLLGLVFGFSLADVDVWLASHRNGFTATADVLFRIGCFGMLSICALAVLGAILDRRNPERPGFGCALLALVVGYFAWLGTFGHS
jgi:hypothetical protein